MAWSSMTDMELSDEDKIDMTEPVMRMTPDYPWGLRICLTERELEKLDLNDEMPDLGDYIHIMAFARVTSVSCSDDQCKRIELQIEKLGVEDENREDD